MWRTVLRVLGVLLGCVSLAAALVIGTMFRIEGPDDLNDLYDNDRAIGCALALAVMLFSTPPPGGWTWRRYAGSLVVAAIIGGVVSSVLMQTHWESYRAKLVQVGAVNP